MLVSLLPVSSEGVAPTSLPTAQPHRGSALLFSAPIPSRLETSTLNRMDKLSASETGTLFLALGVQDAKEVRGTGDLGSGSSPPPWQTGAGHVPPLPSFGCGMSMRPVETPWPLHCTCSTMCPQFSMASLLLSLTAFLAQRFEGLPSTSINLHFNPCFRVSFWGNPNHEDIEPQFSPLKRGHQASHLLGVGHG